MFRRYDLEGFRLRHRRRDLRIWLLDAIRRTALYCTSTWWWETFRYKVIIESKSWPAGVSCVRILSIGGGYTEIPHSSFCCSDEFDVTMNQRIQIFHSFRCIITFFQACFFAMWGVKYWPWSTSVRRLPKWVLVVRRDVFARFLCWLPFLDRAW